jgi:hypothetical protein
LDSTSWICHWAWMGILPKLTLKDYLSLH